VITNDKPATSAMRTPRGQLNTLDTHLGADESDGSGLLGDERFIN